jgi:hypothetical protein
MILKRWTLFALLLTTPLFAQMPNTHSAPANLQVLPKTMADEEVHDLMQQWSDALGTHCSACHVSDPKNLAPNGQPRLNFADDSKPEKTIARSMLQMMNYINQQYLGKIDTSGQPVTCGTCHRGHLGPPPFLDSQEGQPPPPNSGAPTTKK